MDLGDPTLQPVRMLGEGGFGRVFLCKNRQGSDRKFVCVKRIIVQNPKQDMKMIQEEIYIISQLKHPRIVQFIRSYMHHNTVNIVMEYVANGTLHNIIAEHRRRSPYYSMPVGNLLHYFCDILMGLEYLHIRHVIHRDLKPLNLLVDAQSRIKIADFGISAIHNPAKQRLNFSGTLQYMAPEVMRGDRYDFKSDIWSLGCVLYEMCMGYPPFQHARDEEDIKHLVYTMTRDKFVCSDLSASVSKAWTYLCERMLCYDMHRRIALPDILRVDPHITKHYYRQYFDYRY